MLRRPARRRRFGGGLGVILFGAVFALAGGATTYFLSVLPALEAREAESWVATTCTVEAARIVEGKDDDGDPTYRADLTYRYRAGGREHRGGRLDFRRVETSGERSHAQEVLDRYPVGREVTCYHDPETPARVVLERKAPGTFVLGALPLAFVLLGLGIITLGVRELRAGRRPRGPRPDGSILLERVRGDEDGAGFLLIRGGFALAFTTATVGAAVAAKGLDWSILMLLLFACVSIGLQAWFWHGLLSQVGPRVEVIADHAARLGGTVAIAVRCRSFMQIRTLRARLVGREEASHGAGTDRVTDTHTFYERRLGEAEGTNTVDLRAEVKLPSRKAAPTFHGESNHIRWLVAIEADIALWPDVDHQYELDVGAGDERE